MKISLIHPSRGRAQKSAENAKRWISRATSSHTIELIVVIDNDANEYRKYWEAYQGVADDDWNKFGIIIESEGNTVVYATNFAAAHTDSDILLYLSDDFDCPEGWDDLIVREFDGATGPRLVKVDDCLQPFYARVLTIPIMNRALYERLGYFWHPSYKSMFCDEDLWWTANKLGALWSAQHLKFPHNHVSVGKSKDDETYRRSAANWDQGKAIFETRKKLGFPV